MIRVLEFAGRPFIYIFEEFGRIASFFITTLSWLLHPPFRIHVVFKQMEFVGVHSVIVVLINGAFTGMVLA